jgi:hypothetical protein
MCAPAMDAMIGIGTGGNADHGIHCSAAWAHTWVRPYRNDSHWRRGAPTCAPAMAAMLVIAHPAMIRMGAVREPPLRTVRHGPKRFPAPRWPAPI